MRLSPLVPLYTLLFLSACSRDNDDAVTPTPGPGGPAQEVYTPVLNGPQGVQMQVEGELVTHVQGGALIPYFNADGVQNTPPQPSYRYYHAGMYDGERNVFEMHLGILSYTDAFLDPGMFEEFFSEGPREYGSTTSPGLSRVALHYLDADSVLWTTGQGSALQANSTFTITQSSTGYDDLSVFARVICNFECTLYNSGGASMPVTNGILMFEFREY